MNIATDRRVYLSDLELPNMADKQEPQSKKRKDKEQLDPQLLRSIDELIAKRLDAEREFLKSTIGLSVKIAAGAVGLALAVLTVVGITNIGDIRSIIEKTAADRMDEFIKASAPQDLERRLDQIHTKSLISFHLQQARSPDASRARDFELSPGEAQKMVALLTEASTEDVEFYGALEVLKSSTNAQWWLRVDESLQELISAAGEDAWLANRPDRWAAVIDLASDAQRKRVRGSVGALLSDPGTPPEVVVASLRYMDSIGQTLPQLHLERMAASEDRTVAIEAMRGLAYRYPTSSAVAKWIDSKAGGAATPEDLTAALEILGSLGRGRNERRVLSSATSQAARRPLASKLLGLVVDGGGQVTTVARDMQGRRVSRFSIEVPGLVRGRTASVDVGHVRMAASQLLADRAKLENLDAFRRCLLAFYRSSSPRQLKGGSHQTWVQARFNEDSGLIIRGGTVVPAGDLPADGVILGYWVERDPKSGMLYREFAAIWSEDETGTAERREVFEGFVKAEKIVFEFHYEIPE